MLNRLRRRVAQGRLARRRRLQPEIEALLELARKSFVGLQAAWDAADLQALASFTTEPLMADLRAQLEERGPLPNRTEVIELDARLLGIEELREAMIARVEFTGLIRERHDAGVAPFRELWMLAKMTDAEAWRLAQVQSLS